MREGWKSCEAAIARCFSQVLFARSIREKSPNGLVIRSDFFHIPKYKVSASYPLPRHRRRP